jgi:hypothetical protein
MSTNTTKSNCWGASIVPESIDVCSKCFEHCEVKESK